MLYATDAMPMHTPYFAIAADAAMPLLMITLFHYAATLMMISAAATLMPLFHVLR